MKDDIKLLRIRFIIVVMLIVTILMGCIFGVICNLLSNTISRAVLNPITRFAMIQRVRINATIICVAAIAVFTIIAAVASKWIVKPVENSWKEQKQFVNDASHELKTPLTVITTNAEMLGQENLNDEDRIKYSKNIATVSHQMKDLVEDLLNLARIEKGEEAGFEKFNLSEQYYQSILQFEPVLFELGLNLKDNIEKEIYVNGSVQRLNQLLVILLDNAGKYSKQGDVTVDLGVQSKNIVLKVSNPSDQISQDDLKNIFKRFYRKDESHNEKGSFGLGLSIAQSICEAHGGKIKADYSNGIISFIVNLPVA